MSSQKIGVESENFCARCQFVKTFNQMGWPATMFHVEHSADQNVPRGTLVPHFNALTL